MIKKANKKVKNATVTVIDGIKFRSKLEGYMYGLLKRHGIKFQYEQERFELVEGFKHNGKKVQPITYKPDFTSSDFIIETKGHLTAEFRLRHKLFMRYCFLHNEKRPYYMPRTEKECQAVVREILDIRDALPFN